VRKIHKGKERRKCRTEGRWEGKDSFPPTEQLHEAVVCLLPREVEKLLSLSVLREKQFCDGPNLIYIYIYIYQINSLTVHISSNTYIRNLQLLCHIKTSVIMPFLPQR
jgi:hypothetical protein